MQELRASLEVVKATQRRAPDTGDVSDAERKYTVGKNVVEEDAREDVVEECLLRAVSRLGGRAKIEVPMYEGNLDAEELLD
jgi:hypothetical protein